MVMLNAHFDGKVIVPDEPLALKPNQKLRISIETLDAAPSESHGKRTFLVQPGVITYVAPDFDAHLGDDFWGFADDKAKK